MSFSASEAVQFLLEKGLLERATLVDDDVIVSDASRRNSNLKVTHRGGDSYFVKQAQASTPQAAESFRREAAFYWLVANDPEFAVLRGIVPRVYGYEATRGALVLEQFVGAVSLIEAMTPTGTFAPTLAQGIGRSLAAAHADAGASMRAGRTPTPFPRQAHWVLSLGDLPEQSLVYATAGQSRLVQLARADRDLLDMLAAVRAEWVSASIIHSDLKLDNVLVLQGTDVAGAGRIRIIDWELADIGDPAWDVGTVLQACWLQPLLRGQWTMAAAVQQAPPGGYGAAPAAGAFGNGWGAPAPGVPQPQGWPQAAAFPVQPQGWPQAAAFPVRPQGWPQAAAFPVQPQGWPQAAAFPAQPQGWPPPPAFPAQPRRWPQPPPLPAPPQGWPPAPAPPAQGAGWPQAAAWPGPAAAPAPAPQQAGSGGFSGDPAVYAEIGRTLRAFWDAYAERQGLRGADASTALERSIRFAAARMVLTAYETLFDQQDVPAWTGQILTMAKAVFRKPDSIGRWIEAS